MSTTSGRTHRVAVRSAVGYGFRTFAARQPAATERAVQEIQGLGAAMEYYRIKLDELHTTMDGDIGLAWGVHTEDFKMKGQPAEVIRVRFTNTLRWTGSAWKNLLYHRDAQPFGPDARYIRIPAPPAKP